MSKLFWLALLISMFAGFGCGQSESECSSSSDCDQGEHCTYSIEDGRGYCFAIPDSAVDSDSSVRDAGSPLPQRDAAAPPPNPNIPPEPDTVCDLSTHWQVIKNIRFSSNFPVVRDTKFEWQYGDPPTPVLTARLQNNRKVVTADFYDSPLTAQGPARRPGGVIFYSPGTEDFLAQFGIGYVNSNDMDTPPSQINIKDRGAFSGRDPNEAAENVLSLVFEGSLDPNYKFWLNGSLTDLRPLRVARDTNGFVYWAKQDDGPGIMKIGYQCVPRIPDPVDSGLSPPPVDAGTPDPDGGSPPPPPPPSCLGGHGLVSLSSSANYPGLAPDMATDFANQRGNLCLGGICYGGDITVTGNRFTSFDSDDGNLFVTVSYTGDGELNNFTIFENGAIYGSPRNIFSITSLASGGATVQDFVNNEFSGPVGSVTRNGEVITVTGNGWPGTLTFTTVCLP